MLQMEHLSMICPRSHCKSVAEGIRTQDSIMDDKWYHHILPGER